MSKADEDFIEQAKKDFARAEEAERTNRDDALDDLKFARLGDQWPDAVKKEREAQQRPWLTINQMPAFIHQVVNDSRQNRPGIRTHPVDSDGDPEVAELLNGLIRNIEVQSDAEVAYDTGVDQATSSGFGYWRVDLDYAHEDAFDLDIKINRILNQFSVYGDPSSTAADSSDWNVAFVIDQLTLDEFKAKYPDATDTVSWQGSDSARGSDWCAEGGIRVAEAWRRTEEEREIVLLSNGQVMTPDEVERLNAELTAAGLRVVRERKAKFFKVEQKIITGAEVLKTTPWPGRYIPIVPVYGEEVAVEGKRHFHSLIRFAKDPQRIYNYWRTAATELVALAPKRPYIGRVGSFDTDNAKWQSANTQNHAYLEFDGPDKPVRDVNDPAPAGAISQAVSAADDMRTTTGIQGASLGERTNETSGVAIVERKIEGDVGTFHFIDNLSRAIRHTGRILVDLIPKVYDGPRMVRVLGEDKKESKLIPVNGMQPKPPPQGAPGQLAAPPQPGAPAVDEEAKEQAEAMAKVYDLTTGKYDVTVSAGPSFTTRRQEAATQMIELLRAMPAAAPMIGDILAENLDWPGADKFADRLREMREQQAQGAQGDGGAAEMAKIQAEMQQAQAKAAGEVEVQKIKLKGDQELGLLKLQQDKELGLARLDMERELAQQKAVLAAATQTQPQATHPGGDIG